MTEKTYPPLPPSRYETTGEIQDINTFTTNDMRAYYDLGRDMQAQAATQPAAPQGDALDAARYRWLRKHFRFANDSLRELWFDPAIDPNDGGVPEDLDQEIDRAMSNAHSAEVSRD